MNYLEILLVVNSKLVNEKLQRLQLHKVIFYHEILQKNIDLSSIVKEIL